MKSDPIKNECVARFNRKRCLVFACIILASLYSGAVYRRIIPAPLPRATPQKAAVNPRLHPDVLVSANQSSDTADPANSSVGLVTISVSQSGIKQVGGTRWTKGHVKEWPLRHARGWLTYVITDSDGHQLFAGSVADPMNIVREYPGDNSLQYSLEQKVEGVVGLRIPEGAGTQISVYRDNENLGVLLL